MKVLRNQVEIYRPSRYNLIDPCVIKEREINLTNRTTQECYTYYIKYLIDQFKGEIRAKNLEYVVYKGKRPKKIEPRLKKRARPQPDYS